MSIKLALPRLGGVILFQKCKKFNFHQNIYIISDVVEVHIVVFFF